MAASLDHTRESGIGLAAEQGCDEVSSRFTTNPDLSLDAGVASFRSAGNADHIRESIAF